MIAWVAHRIVWFLVRTAVTLACVFTIHNLVNQYAFKIDFKDILLASVCAIVAVRMWSPSCSCQKDKSHHS